MIRCPKRLSDCPSFNKEASCETFDELHKICMLVRMELIGKHDKSLCEDCFVDMGYGKEDYNRND